MLAFSKTTWLIPAGLVLLALVPVAAGVARLVELAGTPEATPANARFVAAPVPVVLHIVAVMIYALLGAFQFWGEFRRRFQRWHRVAGRVLVVFGLAAALSGLWMTQVYVSPPMDQGLVLYLVRMLVGSAMAASLILGVVAILQGDVAGHRAWMMRAYGLGMGAGTQVLTHLPWVLMVGMPSSPATRDVLMTLGWAINVVVVEWILARRVPRGARLSRRIAPFQP